MYTKNSSPFNGDYYDSNGNVRNLLENGVTQKKTSKEYMSPFNGDFYASDGSVHNIDELLGSTGSGDDVPKGCIVMWAGSVETIPSGWALCDGSNGTPDLQNCFIVVGDGNYIPESTGGSDNITIIRYKQETAAGASSALSYIIKL